MSSRGAIRTTSRAVAVGCAALALLASPEARADDRKAEAKTSVDFSKPPAQVEAFDKTRITISGKKDVQGAPTFEVKGQAYYPDGTTYVVSLRHARRPDAFAEQRAVVQKHSFSATFGPFEKIPGGKLVAAARFNADTQPDEVKAALVDGKYFHCAPPCRFDRLNVAVAVHDHGGAAAQAADEEAEKAEIARARTALLDARKVAELVFSRFEKAPGSADPAGALKRLERDETSALEAAASWRAKRAFLLFPDAAVQIDALGDLVVDEARCRAAKLGVEVAGHRSSVAPTDDIEGTSDALKGFLDETKSLDKAWEATLKGKIEELKARIQRAKELKGSQAQPSPPPAK